MRLKGLDPYFSKIQKFFIRPQFPLVSASIEEGCFLVTLKTADFQDFGVLNNNVNQRKLRKDEKFFILEKYKPRAFKRTISYRILIESHGDKLT